MSKEVRDFFRRVIYTLIGAGVGSVLGALIIRIASIETLAPTLLVALIPQVCLFTGLWLAMKQEWRNVEQNQR